MMTQHPQGAISCQWGSIEVVCWPVHKHFIMITFLGHQGLLAWSRTIEHINPPPPLPDDAAGGHLQGVKQLHSEWSPCQISPAITCYKNSLLWHILSQFSWVFLWFVNICYYYKVTSTFTIHSVTYIYLLISDAANKVCRLDQINP